VAHHNAQKAYLPLELLACFAPDKVQPDPQALAKRHMALLNLRD
jgi:hypothetical protein